jgi:Peptidase family M23
MKRFSIFYSLLLVFMLAVSCEKGKEAEPAKTPDKGGVPPSGGRIESFERTPIKSLSSARTEESLISEVRQQTINQGTWQMQIRLSPTTIPAGTTLRIRLWTFSGDADLYVGAWRSAWVHIASSWEGGQKDEVTIQMPNEDIYIWVSGYYTSTYDLAVYNMSSGASSGSYVKPISTFPSTGGYRGFAWWSGSSYHNGADFYCPVGTEVTAILDGEVVINKEAQGFGSLNPDSDGGVIVLKHKNNKGEYFFAVYGHLYRDSSIGRSVKKGQKLGTTRPVYNTGQYVPHLHFGIYTCSNFPSTGWGYSSSTLCWSDPYPYLENNCK